MPPMAQALSSLLATVLKAPPLMLQGSGVCDYVTKTHPTLTTVRPSHVQASSEPPAFPSHHPMLTLRTCRSHIRLFRLMRHAALCIMTAYLPSCAAWPAQHFVSLSSSSGHRYITEHVAKLAAELLDTDRAERRGPDYVYMRHI